MQKLFQTDDIMVKGEIYTTNCLIDNDRIVSWWSCDYHKETPCIRLDFTFRVNGKMKDYEKTFSLKRWESGENYCDNRILIREWVEYYQMLEIFKAFGYEFVENDDGRCSVYVSLIDSWIQELTGWLDVLSQYEETWETVTNKSESI